MLITSLLFLLVNIAYVSDFALAKP
jgi:hypothetical protein